MGNEHSKNKELTKNGKIPEKHKNGAVNGISASITSNGLEIGVNGETIIQQNATPVSSNPATESNGSDCQHVSTQVISETPETTVQKEETGKAANEDQTDGSLPATNPKPESDSSGEEAAATIIVEHPEECECPHGKSEISTQTDFETEAHISTQTSDNSATNTGSPMEEDTVMETAATEEHSLTKTVVMIAEEAVEDPAYDRPSGNQPAGIIITEEVNIDNDVYENIVFIAERVEVTDNFDIRHIRNYNLEAESINEPEKTEPEITQEQESNPNKSITVDEISESDNMTEESVPLEVSFSLPKVVADCIEAVFSADPETSYYAAGNTSEPRVEEVITEDNGERAGDMSADAALIETAEPEPNAVTPEAGEANGVQSPDGEPVTEVIETIFEVVYEDPNATPGDQDTPVEEAFVPLETEIVVNMESASEEIAMDDAVGVEDAPEKLSPASDGEPSKPENQLIAIEELPEISSMSPDDEIQIKLQSIPEIIITEAAVGEDATADVAPDTVEESEISFVIVKENAEVILEAAIDALCLELEHSVLTPLEPAADNDSPLEEEVLIATVFVPLCAEQDASITVTEEPVEETIIPPRDEMIEEAIQALSNEFKAVPQSVDEDIAVQETSTEGEVAILKEAVEESDEAEVKTEVSGYELLIEVAKEPVEEKIIPTKDEIVAEDMKKEAKQALSNESEAVPQSVNKNIAVVQETSTDGEVAISKETVEESDVAEEKNKDKPMTETTEEPVEETIIPTEEETVAEEMKKEAKPALSNESEAVPQSIDEDIAVQETSTDREVAISENTVEKSDVAEEKNQEKPLTEATEEPVEETIIPTKDEIVVAEMKKEATQALSNESKAVPQSVDEGIAIQSTSTDGKVAILEEPVRASDVAEEKTEDKPLTEATEEPVKETIILTKDETVVGEMKKEAVQALSNESEAVPQSVDKNITVQETSTDGEVAILKEPVEESDVAEEKNEDKPMTKATEEPVAPRVVNVVQAEVLLEDAAEEKVTPSVVAVEVLESSPVISEEAVKESVSSLEQQPKGGLLGAIVKTIGDYFTEEMKQETKGSGNVSSTVADNTEDSQIAAVDESVAACVEAIVEKITTEDVVEAECNPVTSEEVAPEIVTEAKQKAEDESSANKTVPSQDHRKNMEAVLVKLQLACASVVEESAYKLGRLAISAKGYSITVTIHVAPKKDKQ